MHVGGELGEDIWVVCLLFPLSTYAEVILYNGIGVDAVRGNLLISYTTEAFDVASDQTRELHQTKSSVFVTQDCSPS